MIPAHGVQRPAENVVDAVHREHCLRDVGFALDDGAGGEEEVDEGRGERGGVECQGGDTDCGVYAGDVERVFSGDGKTVEGAKGRGCAGEVVVKEAGAGEGGGEEGFGKGLQELTGYGGSLEKM